MAIVLTNGDYYIGRGKKGTGKRLNKTKNIEEAEELKRATCKASSPSV